MGPAGPGAARFAHFAKGAVFELSFHAIYFIELKFNIDNVQTCRAVSCAISNNPR
jgi:hypothetical protein